MYIYIYIYMNKDDAPAGRKMVSPASWMHSSWRRVRVEG